MVSVLDFFMDDVGMQDEFDGGVGDLLNDPSFLKQFLDNDDIMVDSGNSVVGPLVMPVNSDETSVVSANIDDADSLSKSVTTTRFVKEGTEKLERFSKGFVPECTQANTMWAVDTFLK